MKRLLLIILIAVLVSSCTRSKPQLLYYNAYSPLYDEYFILKSDKPLSNKDIVWFDDKATAVNYTTEYVAMIISPYNQ